MAEAHRKDLETQGKYGVSYLRYWVDEKAGKIFCLVEAESAEDARRASRGPWPGRRRDLPRQRAHMRTKLITLIAAGLLLATGSTTRADANGSDDHHKQRQLAQLKKATAPYRKVSHALADGFQAFAIPPSVGGTPTTGLGLAGDPTCFDDPAGGMGVHYVKGIDGSVDVTHPEALVYEVGEHGHLRLGRCPTPTP